jgi:hypothetical protein
MNDGPFGPGSPFGPGGPRRVFVEPGSFPHHGGPPALAWAIFALVLALVVGFAIALLVGLASRRGPRWQHLVPAGGPQLRGPIDPFAVLSMRYARGEIGRDEFIQATDDLRPRPSEAGEPPPPPSS